MQGGWVVRLFGVAQEDNPGWLRVGNHGGQEQGDEKSHGPTVTLWGAEAPVASGGSERVPPAGQRDEFLASEPQPEERRRRRDNSEQYAQPGKPVDVWLSH